MSRLTRAAVAIVAVLCLSLAAAIEPAQAQIVTRQTTPGGLAFRYVHMPDSIFQSLHFAWCDGTAVALPGMQSAPALGAALIMEGPRGLSRSAMIEDFRDLQATVNLTTSVSLAQGQVTAPRAKFAAAVRLFARVLAEAAMPAERLGEIARNASVALRQGEGNAETMAQRLYTRLVVADGPHRRYLTGDPASYGRVTLADIEAWRRNILVRDGLTLVSVGPMAADEAGREIDLLFAGLTTSGNTPAPVKPALRAPGKIVVLERPAVQTAIVGGGPLDTALTPDLLRTQLAVSVFGGGTSSRLWLAVREQLGAAYGVSAAVQTVDFDTRLLAIRTAVANDKAAGVIEAVRNEYARFLADGLAETELDPMKRSYVTGHRDRLRRGPALAAALLPLALQGYPDDYLATYEQRLEGSDRAAVEAAVRAAFPKPPLTVAVVAPSAEGLPADCVIKTPDEIARCD
jgi:zinc protease